MNRNRKLRQWLGVVFVLSFAALGLVAASSANRAIVLETIVFAAGSVFLAIYALSLLRRAPRVARETEGALQPT